MASILVITQRVPYPPNKGEKLRTFHQIEHLLASGHSITVLSPIDTAEELKNAASLASKLNIQVITKALSHKIIRLIRGFISGQSLSAANFFSSELMKEVNEQAKNMDVILCSASSLAHYVFELETNHKPVLLMDFMDVDSDKWLQYAKNASLPMRFIYKREHELIKKLEQQVVAHFDEAFIIAQAELDLFQSNVVKCNNLHVLGNGIDQDIFMPNHKTTEHMHYLFTGVMDYKPNVDAVLWFVANCWEAIKTEVPNAKLTIAGMNPEPKITALRKDSSIEVTGFVDDIMPFFHRANVFIAPFQIARGVQNKVLQAMACAIPVVSTHLGAEGIDAHHNENMMIADSHQDFTAACLLLANDKDLNLALGNQALQTITANYSWNSVLKPLERAVKKCEERNEDAA